MRNNVRGNIHNKRPENKGSPFLQGLLAPVPNNYKLAKSLMAAVEYKI